MSPLLGDSPSKTSSKPHLPLVSLLPLDSEPVQVRAFIRLISSSLYNPVTQHLVLEALLDNNNLNSNHKLTQCSVICPILRLPTLGLQASVSCLLENCSHHIRFETFSQAPLVPQIPQTRVASSVRPSQQRDSAHLEAQARPRPRLAPAQQALRPVVASLEDKMRVVPTPSGLGCLGVQSLQHSVQQRVSHIRRIYCAPIPVLTSYTIRTRQHNTSHNRDRESAICSSR